MKPTDITDALTGIDEALLDRAVSSFNPGEKSRKNTKRMIISIAAGIAVIAVTALSVSRIGKVAKPAVVGENTGSLAADETTETQAVLDLQTGEDAGNYSDESEIDIDDTPTTSESPAAADAPSNPSEVPVTGTPTVREPSSAADTTLKPSEVPVTETEEPSTAVQTPSEIKNPVCYFWWKNKLNVKGDLYNAMNNNPDGVFHILTTYRPVTANITSYVFEGKTLSEWAVKAYEPGAGEAEMEAYKRAYDAFMNDYVIPSAVGVLSGKGIDCEINDNGLTFFATADQLESIAFDDLPNWYFDLI